MKEQDCPQARISIGHFAKNAETHIPSIKAVANADESHEKFDHY